MSTFLESPRIINGVCSYPAPWKLEGKGYIILYKFPKDFIMEKGLIPAFLRTCFAGGLGAVMMIDYIASNAGPYSELLFIPGKFRFGGKQLNCITKIYVNTMESVVNGWENWAIPKEMADIIFTPLQNESRDQVFVQKNNQRVIEVCLKYSSISFPIHTRLIPFPLVQEKTGRLYYTNFIGKGTAQFAQIEKLRVNPELFPDIHPYHPVACMHVDRFTIKFPPARITIM
jgi:hypothetical protein